MANEQNNLVEKKRIGNKMLVCMVLVAIILDLISLIPIINALTLTIAGIIFTLWWWKLGLGLIDLKKVINYGMAIVIEVIPFLSMLPGITVAVLVMFAFSRFEDKSGLHLTGEFSHNKKNLFNKDGRMKARRLAANDSRKSIARAKRIKARSETSTQARSRSFVRLPDKLNQ